MWEKSHRSQTCLEALQAFCGLPCYLGIQPKEITACRGFLRGIYAGCAKSWFVAKNAGLFFPARP
jgi:hypothetical protein